MTFRLTAPLIALADVAGQLSVRELKPGTLVIEPSSPDSQGVVEAVAEGMRVRFFERDLKDRANEILE